MQTSADLVMLAIIASVVSLLTTALQGICVTLEIPPLPRMDLM